MDKQAWLDILKGFLLNIGVAFGFFVLTLIIMGFFSAINMPESSIVLFIYGVINIVMLIVVEVILIRILFKRNKNMAIGMLAGLIVPFATIGSCSVGFMAVGMMGI